MSEGEDFFRAPPSVISDEMIVAVGGRSGWGSGWQAQVFGKPWLVHPYQKGDDPEIYFNNKTIEYLFIGEIIKYETYDFQSGLKGIIASCGSVMRAHTRSGQIPVFDQMDGIKYVAERITQNIMKK